MKLLILSDLHIEFGTFRVPDVDADVVVLAGDVTPSAAKALRWARRAGNFGQEKPLVLVPGNRAGSARLNAQRSEISGLAAV